MKIGYKRLLSLALTGTLASGLCMQSSAFSFPSAYWPLQAAWFEATEAQDMDATISTAQKTYELFKDVVELVQRQVVQKERNHANDRDGHRHNNDAQLFGLFHRLHPFIVI